MMPHKGLNMDSWAWWVMIAVFGYVGYQFDRLNTRVAKLAERVNALEYRTQLPYDESQADYE